MLNNNSFLEYCCPLNTRSRFAPPLLFNKFKQSSAFQALMRVCVSAIFLLRQPPAGSPKWQPMSPPSLFRDAQGIPAHRCGTSA